MNNYMNRVFSSSVAMLLFFNLFSLKLQAQFAGGTGTKEDPAQINSIEQLQEIHNFPSLHFILIFDIDAAVTVGWNDGLGFMPIGEQDQAFTGSFNGNGYVLDNLNISRSEAIHVGLFGFVDEGLIENVILRNTSVTGGDKTGGLAGYNNGIIRNSYTGGSVFGDDRTGGLVGENRGEIIDSHSDADVSGGDRIGGLVGWSYGGAENGIRNSHAAGNVSGGIGAGGLVGWSYGLVFNSYATGNVTGTERAGGLAGENYGIVYNSYSSGNISSNGFKIGGLLGENYGQVLKSRAFGRVSGGSEVGGLVGCNYGDVNESYATGNVTGVERVGGLAGESYGVVSNSYARGRVSGNTMVGGLIGTNSYLASGGMVCCSYATGVVTGINDVGGLIGANDESVESSYWDTQSSGQANGIGWGNKSGAEGLTTSQMKGESAIDYMNQIPFFKKWINNREDYPKLLWDTFYFQVRIDANHVTIKKGQNVIITALITNIGGVDNVQTIKLLNDDGQLLDSYDNLALRGRDSLSIDLLWNSGDVETGQYVLKVISQDNYGSVTVQIVENNIPSDVELMQNYPNPFNSSTWIQYGLPDPMPVKLVLTDILGRHVQLIVNGEKPAGWQFELIDATQLPSGIYIYRLYAGNSILSRTMLLVK